MKNLSTAHVSIKQSILGELINTSESGYYANVKISLLNNAIVFPVPLDFSIDGFSAALADYFAQDLKIDAQMETIGDDIFSLPFSPIGLGLMKKAVVYTIIDSHLYINIVPLKEIENANYSESKISGLLSSGKTDKIYDFVEQYILSCYPTQVAEHTKPCGRYFYSTSLGLQVVLANHIEDDEIVLAKLDIYKIEKSKSNALTSDDDESFYLLTNKGAYIFVIDDNLQEKYVETISDAEMVIQSKIGRNMALCGNTQWLCNRDNEGLFQEVSKFNNQDAATKIYGFSQMLFNLGDADDKKRSAYLHNILADTDQSPFTRFAANLIEFSLSIKTENSTIGFDNQLSISLMESANSLLSEEGFETKVEKFLSDYQFQSLELVALIFVISRVKNRISDTKVFANVMKTMKDRYFKSDSNVVNRGFVDLSIARKLNMIAEREQAYQFASEAFDIVGYNPASVLSPGLNARPDSPLTGDVISYLALEEMYKSASLDKDKMSIAKEIASLKPLIKGNLDNILKYQPSDAVASKVNVALSVFDVESFSNLSYTSQLNLDGKFSKLKESLYMPEFTEWRKTYSGFKSWAQKAHVDKSFSTVKTHGELVDTNNYHLLFDLCSSLSKYFELDEVQVFVFKNRGQGVMANDDGDSKYIFIDEELLDINNENYMNGNELAFVLAREFASLKLGFTKLTCHQQWRNFAINGIQSLDIISGFAAEPDFIKGELGNYTKLSTFADLLNKYSNYFNFDVDDVEGASLMLLETMQAFGSTVNEQLSDLREREFAALTTITSTILDRVGLLVCCNFASAIKAIIHSDYQIRGGAQFIKENSVSALACTLDSEDKPVNYDFAMRLNALISFYISDSYKKY